MRVAVMYADGSTRDVYGAPDWRAVPDTGVLHVVAFDGVGNSTCREDGTPVTDRSLWTGDEDYDPFGWGVKRGALVDDATYWRTWREACDGLD